MRQLKPWKVVGTMAFFGLFVADVARAGLIPGGGKSSTDCLVEWDVQGFSGSNRVSCMDGDPNCDTDGQCQGTCTFSIRLCVNQTNISACTPSAFKKPPKVKMSKVPVPSSTGSEAACGNFVDVKVPLKHRHGGNKKGLMKLQVIAKGSKGPADKDLLFLTCTPRTGTCPPPTTTTTTQTSTTTTTTGPCPGCLSFTTSQGVTTCGGAGLNPPPGAPASGAIFSDTGATTKIDDLGLGCLYIGGGKATTVPPSLIPDGATNFFMISGMNLVAQKATGAASCTAGAGPGKHCVNAHCNTDADCDGTAGSCAANQCVNPGTQPVALACNTDVDCGGSPGSCGLDANCYFGPPLPIATPPPNDALTTCVLNVIQTDASGTGDATTGDSNVTIPLASRVYITGNSGSPCPKCISGTCAAGGEDTGHACITTSNLMTSLDCRPPLAGFQAPLPVTLTPLTTSTASKTATDGIFCPGQVAGNPGAFGQPTTKAIHQTGVAAGDLTDHMPHPSVLAAIFCIPKTGNVAIDGVASLPGPGAIGLNGTAQVTP